MKKLNASFCIALTVLILAFSPYLHAAENITGMQGKTISKKGSDLIYKTNVDTKIIWDRAEFKRFTRNFMIHFFKYANYHNIRPLLTNRDEFYKAVESSDGEDNSMAEIYANYGLDYYVMLDLKNEIDNDVLRLLYEIPEYMDLDETDAINNIIEGIDYGMNSQDGDWIIIREEVGLVTNGDMLTIDEVWGCIKQALGFGTGTIVGIGALRDKLAKDGIQTVLRNVTAWLAKRAGWIGAAISVIEFGMCIYEETHD